jgi:NADP-dependent 3-hydroxy acid dehydrogenase YdfG
MAKLGDTMLKRKHCVTVGTLSNNQHKHPDRRTMNIDTAAEYIKWIADQPAHININELSIDPVQGSSWYED